MPVMVGSEIYGEGEDDIAETIAVALASGVAGPDLQALARASSNRLTVAAAARGYRVRGLDPHLR